MDDDFYGAAYKGTGPSQSSAKKAGSPGFGAVADSYAQKSIDLNDQLIMNKPATFFFRMKGDAMMDAGINEGDILIVDRSIKATSSKIIVGSLDGELLVRRFQHTFNKMFLVPENKRYKAIEVGEFGRFEPWGVVTCVIHIIEPMLEVFAGKTREDKPIS